ncbi:MAG: efflux RND transporter periplasmic adaptor subunit [Pseudomonadota bacterium]
MALSKSASFLTGVMFVCLLVQWGPGSPGNINAAISAAGEETGGSSQGTKPVQPAQANSQSFRAEAAVIRPFRQATVAAEVPGIVEARSFAEGDAVGAGIVIFEISPDRYKLGAEKSRERMLALEAARERAEQELKLKEYLLSHNAATRQEVLKARTEAKITEHQSNEAQKDYEFARRDLDKSLVRAPFKGHIVAFYREPHEAVQRFEQLFLIADTSQVYAVVNVPEAQAAQLGKGSPAVFVRPERGSFPGTVAGIGKAIDPASRTKKVQVLIDNARGKLEMGMLGAVEFLPGQRGNP